MEHLRVFVRVSSKFDTWLAEQESKLEDCGPIGANLDRCLEQKDILEVCGGRREGQSWR